jgi:hypothetical protein
MNNTEMFSYPAINFIEMLIIQGRYNSVDSALSVLKKRFPKDKYLETKIYKWKTQNEWYDF